MSGLPPNPGAASHGQPIPHAAPDYGRNNPHAHDYTVPSQQAGVPSTLYGQPCQFFSSAGNLAAMVRTATPTIGREVLCAPPLMKERRVWALHGLCDHRCVWTHDPYEWRDNSAIVQNPHAHAGASLPSSAYPSRLKQYSNPAIASNTD